MRRLFSKIEAGLFVYGRDYNLWAAGFSVWLRGFSTAISAWIKCNVLFLWIRISKPEGLRGLEW